MEERIRKSRWEQKELIQYFKYSFRSPVPCVLLGERFGLTTFSF